MNSENLDKDLWSLFLAELGRSIDDSHVDYTRIEAGLTIRITQAEREGELMQLRAHEDAGGVDWARLEAGLFRRIQEHVEYEEPVDECIASEESLPNASWDRIGAKVDEKAKNAGSLESWECLLKSEKMLLPGQWERIEDKLQQRLQENGLGEEWENQLKADTLDAPDRLSHEETSLDAGMQRVDSLEPWERILAKEEMLLPGSWEKTEQALFERIDRHEKFKDLLPQGIWLSFGLFLQKAAWARNMAMILILAVAAAVGWRFYLANYSELTTLVYRAQGMEPDVLEKSYQPGSVVETGESGALTLVNRRGFVELQNGSELRIRKANRSTVHYSLTAPGEGKFVTGTATFFVARSQGSERFAVETGAYTIEVLGTYFKVQPDLEGRPVTQVMEGKVRIRSEEGSVEVEAGEVYDYDHEQGLYRVRTGGPVILREEIEAAPKVEELLDYPAMAVFSDVERAEVRVEGKYKGVTPLVMRHPSGSYRLKLVKKGYLSKDTIVHLESGTTQTVRLQLERDAGQRRKSVADAGTPKSRRKPVRAPDLEKTESLNPEAGIGIPENEVFLGEAEKLERGDWRKALSLYSQVLDSRSSSRLQRETARFSIARLKATHLTDKAPAKKDFLQYLAIHPSGVFAGESWLRLAELELKEDPGKAVEYYQQYFRKYPNHHRVAELQHRVGLIHLQQKRYDEAIAMFQQALANMLSNQAELRTHVYRNYRQALIAKGDTTRAESIERRYLMPSPN